MGLVAIKLAISKARHEAIEEGVPKYVMKYVRDSYEGISTFITYGTKEVPTQKGGSNRETLYPHYYLTPRLNPSSFN
jgi:hypothetical protein